MIHLESIQHWFDGPGGQTKVVDGVDLTIKRGEFVVLIGHSGCGKSTLMNMVSGLFPPSSGRVLYNDKPLTGVNTAVGYVTQRDTLLPWRTVAGNVGLPLEVRRVGEKERTQRVQSAIRMVGLEGFERHFPRQLSGGMRRRILIARTLIYEPETLLLDEPFGGLDAQTKLLMQNELMRLWQDLRQTVLFVTHDLDEAIALADRIIVLTPRPCRIKEIFQVHIPRPRDVVGIRSLPEYQAVQQALWNALKEEAEV